MDRPTFSQSWSRVSRLTPTLRSHVQITRQMFRGEPWYVVHDPVSNNFFRLNPVAYHLVGLLDAKRSVDEVWRMTLERYGDMSPTQNEVIGLLGQLNESNLLRVDLPSDAEPLLRRQRQRQVKHWGGQAMSLLFIRIPIFNPDWLLRWLVPLFRPLLSTTGLILWAAWMGYVIWQFLPKLREFINDAQSVLSPTNWGWMIVLFITTKVIHELGHGLICKRMGGVVPEVGIMMLVLFPVPYVDATSSWNFTTKWRRLLVGAGGMIFELAVAGIGVLVWLHAEPGSLAKQLSYNVVFMASVATILFNANPLLKFDGYYMLSDVLEVPNLYDRSRKYLQWLIQRYVYGMSNAMPVSSHFGEKFLLFNYGIASNIYKVFILFGIILFVSGQLYTLGLVLAGWSLIAWAIVPLCKFGYWLATNPALHEHRLRAVLTTSIFTAALLGTIGAIPMPDRHRAVGIVESVKRVDVAIRTDGFVTEVRVEAGQTVRAGDVLLVADSHELRAGRDELRARLKGLESARRQALTEDLVQMQGIQAQIIAIDEELHEVEQRIEDLVLRAPQDGTVISKIIMTQLLGQYITRGQVVAQIVDLDQLRVTALVDQARNSAMFDKQNNIEGVELRTAGFLGQTLPSHLIQAFPSGRSNLPHPALGYAGGGSIALNPDDPEGQTTMQPQFELWLELPHQRPEKANDNTAVAYPGQRVYVRFTLEKRVPWINQWIRKLRQVFRERLAV